MRGGTALKEELIIGFRRTVGEEEFNKYLKVIDSLNVRLEDQDAVINKLREYGIYIRTNIYMIALLTKKINAIFALREFNEVLRQELINDLKKAIGDNTHVDFLRSMNNLDIKTLCLEIASDGLNKREAILSDDDKDFLLEVIANTTGEKKTYLERKKENGTYINPIKKLIPFMSK